VEDALFPINAGTDPAELGGDHKDELWVWLGLFSRTAVIERETTIAYASGSVLPCRVST